MRKVPGIKKEGLGTHEFLQPEDSHGFAFLGRLLVKTLWKDSVAVKEETKRLKAEQGIASTQQGWRR